jgi:thiamine-monophosphate kinase
VLQDAAMSAGLGIVSEFALIAALREVLAQPSAKIIAGIGDDAAVIRGGPGDLVWTIDAQVEDVHFRRAWLSWADVGFRAIMAAASDLAAMGAEPLAALAALTVPPSVDRGMLVELARGQREAAEYLRCPVVGGNVANGATFSVTTTVLGRTDRPLMRTGAKPGDLIQVAGRLGHAALGLRALESGEVGYEAHVDAWRRPVAQIAAGLRARTLASAAVDVSDGLGQDVEHLARASGVRVTLDEAQLLKWGPPGQLQNALSLALGGGEDYALVVAAPSLIGGFEVVGAVTDGEGVFVKCVDGREVPLETLPKGYTHAVT